MKNIYDNEKFFDEYSKMNRSKEGLKGAGEWEALKKILPELRNKTMLDLGSGYGWHSIYAAEQGAKYVLGIDSSDKMLATAKRKNQYNNVEFKNVDINNLESLDTKFDLVFSSLALHYIEDFDKVVDEVNSLLNSNGEFIFSVEHPIFTSEGTEQWVLNDDGSIKYFPVDRYFDETLRETNFWDTPVTKYHRTLETYIETLIKHRFSIQHLIEPTPPDSMLDIPGMKDEFRRPMMLIISAKKI
ncbi:class I SAM-dependent methyltransferase [Weissella kandleri]|uniref:class I SAM-dependent methyltransferase n=1 Tax=Weissella kandleri TaxID=1616 RepID=UPI00387E38F8